MVSIAASEARDRVAETAGRVQDGGERTGRTGHGETVAALVPVTDAVPLDRPEDRLVAEPAEARLAACARPRDVWP